jgi:hypothetical protein
MAQKGQSWWIVTLREDGDDEDSLYIVRAADQAAAEVSAQAEFITDNYGGGTPSGTTLYLNHVVRCNSEEKPEHVRSVPV